MTCQSPLLKDLSKTPSYSYGHLWADFIELRCLVSQDKVYNLGLFLDLDTESDELRADLEVTPEDVDHHEEISERNWADIKSNFSLRQSRFGASWPFHFENDQLELRYDHNNYVHKAYLFLLLCSALKYCSSTRRDELTKKFEFLGFEAMKEILPGWTVKPFGAHHGDFNGYLGTIADKFHSLAQDIKARHVADPDDFDPRDTGDGGLDVVAFKDFGDPLGNLPVAFVQCGCSPKDWEKKQYEASPLALNQRITPQHPGANYYIMPHDMRGAQPGKWVRNAKIGDVILIDRGRLLKILQDRPPYRLLDEGGALVAEACSMNISYFEG